MLRFALSAAAVAAVAFAGEARIAGDALLLLDGTWTATSDAVGAAPVPALVPGDLISDLARAGVIDDPWHNLTWRVEAGRWDLAAWNVSRSFATPGWSAAGVSTLLVFDSVKMAANITINGVALGAATSQHLRYEFDVSALLAPAGGANSISVAFPATVDDTRNDDGRYQGCSGGWDCQSLQEQSNSEEISAQPSPLHPLPLPARGSVLE
jgi:hypothetical protein